MKRTNSLHKFPVIAAFLVLAFCLPGASLCAAVTAPGVPHFFQVDEHVYRGAQPSKEGFQSLAKLGVKTIIDLRESGERSRAEEQTVTAAGMRYVSIPMNGLVAPSDDQINKALALMNDPASGPVFVHCREGVDRTGTIIACYRIQHYHWRAQEAIHEAKAMGMHWMHFALRSYVRDFGMQPSDPTSLTASAASGQ